MSKDTVLRLALKAMKVSNSAWKTLADSGDAGFWKAEEQGYYQLNEQAIKAVEAALEAKDEQCRHRIADARNPVVKDGYLCVDCGALFSAADHAMPKQEAKDEPVAWYLQGLNQRGVSLKKETQKWKPLYTTPPQRKPLTDETRNWIVATCPTPRHIIDAVERMHGIKGEA